MELGRTFCDAVVRAATSSGRVSCALSANIMIIIVLERRSEIGLGRALDATKNQIRTQFLAESILLAVIGGIAGGARRRRGNGRVRKRERVGRRHPMALRTV